MNIAADNLLGIKAKNTVQLARLLSQSVALFEGNKEKAFRWFLQPNRALGNLSPLEMAGTETGAREVEKVIGRLEHGVFS